MIGSSSAPYVNSLARRYGLMTQSYAIRHPSLPNYLALTSGSTQGIGSDCTDCGVSATNIVDQLEGAGISWKAYLEDVPSPCFLGAQAGGYAKKHNPFAYYADIVRSPARCGRLIGFAAAGRRPARGAAADVRVDLAEPVRRRARLRGRRGGQVPRAQRAGAAARAGTARLSGAAVGRGHERPRLLRRRQGRAHRDDRGRARTCARARARRRRSITTACSGASSRRSGCRRWAARPIPRSGRLTRAVRAARRACAERPRRRASPTAGARAART